MFNYSLHLILTLSIMRVAPTWPLTNYLRHWDRITVGHRGAAVTSYLIYRLTGRKMDLRMGWHSDCSKCTAPQSQALLKWCLALVQSSYHLPLVVSSGMPPCSPLFSPCIVTLFWPHLGDSQFGCPWIGVHYANSQTPWVTASPACWK